MPEGGNKDLVFEKVWISELSLFHRPKEKEIPHLKEKHGISLIITIEGEKEDPHAIE